MVEIMEAIEWQGFKAGGRRDFFIAYADLIGKFIETNKLKPVSANQILSPSIDLKELKAANVTTAPTYIIPWWYRGGKKFAHLHYSGEAYMLNARQWQDFSTQILQDMAKKVTASKTVSFDNVLDLSDTLSSINMVL